jgi:cell division protein FtsQ
MGIKKNITSAVFICLWAIAGAGVIVLLVAAVNSRKQQTCKGYDIDINGNSDADWFIDKNDVVNVLTGNRSITIKNKKIQSFDLNRLEARLEKEVWIKDAELFFDNNGILKVKIEEREPVSRIFSSLGESFYLDSSGLRLPLSDKMSAKLPVFTGFPGNGKKLRTASDKKLIKQIKELSLFLLKDTSWMYSISQIDITAAREFEIIPTEGNYIIEFGDGNEIEKKFKRLLLFNKQVLSKTGTDKYERVKVQYDKQVIGVKKENNNN